MKSTLFTVLAVLAVSAPALAAPAPGPSITVRCADLDLDRAKDAAIMLKRIRRAAAEVCLVDNVGNDSATVMRMNACYRDALGAAVAGLNAPKVTEAFAPGPGHKQLARLR